MAVYSSPTAVRRHLSRRWLRLHSSLIGLTVVAAGYGFARLLWWAGVDNLALRYAVVVGLSYVALLVCVRVWIAYVYWRQGDSDGVGDAVETAIDAGDLPSSGGRSSARGSWADGADLPFEALGDDLGIGIVLALLAGAVVVAAGAGAYLLLLAPEMLVDAAVAWVIAAGMVRRTAAHSQRGWLVAVLGRTWWVVALFVVIAVALGSYIEVRHPDASTLEEAVMLARKGK